MNHERAWVATKKGLFELRLRDGLWTIASTSFLGEPVTMMYRRRQAASACLPR